MFLLQSTDSWVLKALLEAAVATTQPSFTVGGVTYAATTTTPYSNDGALNGVTPVTLAATPSASEYREINFLTIYNEDTDAVTVQLKETTDLGTTVIGRFVLPAAATLFYTKKHGFRIITRDSTILRTRAASPVKNLSSYYHVSGLAGLTCNYPAGLVNATALTTAALTNLNFYARVFQAPYRKSPTVNRIGAWCTTGVAATGVRLGIYSMRQANDDFMPGTLLYGSADVPTTASGALATAVPDLVLVPGQLYWVVCWANGAPTMRAATPAGSAQLGVPDALTATTPPASLIGAATPALVYGTLPSVFPAGPALSSSNTVMLTIRYSA